MDRKWLELYEALGYRAPTRAAASVEEAPRLALGARVFESMAPSPTSGGADELPPLGPEALYALRDAFMREPEDVLRWAEEGLGAKVTVSAFMDALQEVDLLLKSPEQALDRARSADLRAKTAEMLPPDFTFPLRTEEIPIHPASTRFEPLADLRGWLLFCGPSWLKWDTVK